MIFISFGEKQKQNQKIKRSQPKYKRFIINRYIYTRIKRDMVMPLKPHADFVLKKRQEHNLT